MPNPPKGRGYTAHSRHLTNLKQIDDLLVGEVVQWYSNGYRYGRLISINHKWAYVTYAGKRKRLPTSELRAYHHVTST